MIDSCAKLARWSFMFMGPFFFLFGLKRFASMHYDFGLFPFAFLSFAIFLFFINEPCPKRESGKIWKSLFTGLVITLWLFVIIFGGETSPDYVEMCLQNESNTFITITTFNDTVPLSGVEIIPRGVHYYLANGSEEVEVGYYISSPTASWGVNNYTISTNTLCVQKAWRLEDG